MKIKNLVKISSMIKKINQIIRIKRRIMRHIKEILNQYNFQVILNPQYNKCKNKNIKKEPKKIFGNKII